MYEQLLAGRFGIAADSVTEVRGGWAAAAYRVDAGPRRYFLKVYDKGRPSIAQWTARIDDYVPALRWLSESTALRGRVPRPVYTVNGACSAEDESGIYLVFPFIEGETIGERPLDRGETVELAGIIAELHTHGGDALPFAAGGLAEDISLPFCGELRKYLGAPAHGDNGLRAWLGPFRALLESATATTEHLRDTRRANCAGLVLCHTDAHNWNLMHAGRLILIDWEGLRLAPPEADLFMFEDYAFFGDFLEEYGRLHPGFHVDEGLLLFYLFRRRMEDIWEFIAQLLYDRPDETLVRTICRQLEREFAGTRRLLGRYNTFMGR